ncbi:MAG: 50S ribosomal protein L35 [bacterium]
MTKIKTHKAISKRFKVTKNKKVLKRKSGQGHFNSRESGNTTRKKRRDVEMDTTLNKNIRTLMPYN